MSIFRYLKDNFRFLIFYLVLMTFILMVIFLDRSNRVLTSNLMYIIIVSLFMFIVFLVQDYVIKSKHINKVMELKSAKDKTPLLPKSLDFKDEVYDVLLTDLYNFYVESIKKAENQFVENSDFMTTWVHEIKTPITTLKLLMDNLQCEDETPVTSIKEEIDKIDDYVEKVLYYSRCDDFTKDYIISEVSLNKLIKESVKKHSTIFIRKRISFVNYLNKDITVDSDKKWLLFIIDQIISNSLNYTASNGEVKVDFLEDHKEMVLIIEDNGRGIKNEDIERVFSKAFTGNNGRSVNTKATGLGLYLSRRMAKRLGHYITLESEYGKGTSVYIHFPKWNDYYKDVD